MVKRVYGWGGEKVWWGSWTVSRKSKAKWKAPDSALAATSGFNARLQVRKKIPVHSMPAHPYKSTEKWTSILSCMILAFKVGLSDVMHTNIEHGLRHVYVEYTFIFSCRYLIRHLQKVPLPKKHIWYHDSLHGCLIPHGHLCPDSWSNKWQIDLQKSPSIDSTSYCR